MDRRRFLAGLCAPASAVLPLAAFAQQDWPARTITLVATAAAGSGTDILARELAAKLAPVLGQPVIVDNKPGGSGVVGIQQVLRSPADGHTLLYSNAATTVMAGAMLKLPYDVTRDLTAVSQTAVGGVMLSVPANFPAKDLKGLVRLVLENPGKFSYGTTSLGSAAHLTMEWLKKQTGMQLTAVAYRQVTQMFTEIASGTLSMGWSDPASVLPFIESGKLRGIALNGGARVPRTPDVPTIAEQGWPLDAAGWFGVFAPAATPRGIVQRLSQEINRIQADAQTAARMTALNLEPPPVKSPEEFGAIVANDLQKWKRIAAETGVKVE
jgi:tripartite-type tricarboxylate transporter receptor subunit TctC